MSLFSKQKHPSDQATRINIARTIYSTVINLSNREAHTRQQYEQLPSIAAKRAVEYADALMAELKNKRSQPKEDDEARRK